MQLATLFQRNWLMPPALVATALAALLSGSSPTAGDGAALVADDRPSPALAAKVDELEQYGLGHRAEAADAFEPLVAQTSEHSADRIEVLTVQGLLLAPTTDPERALRAADALQAQAKGRLAEQARAAAYLVRAYANVNRGDLTKATEYMALANSSLPQTLDVRRRLRFAMINAIIQNDAGKLEDAVRLWHEAVQLADELGTPWRRSGVRSTAAFTYLRLKQLDQGYRLVHESIDIAKGAQEYMQLGRAYNLLSLLDQQAGDIEGQRKALRAAIENARMAGAKSDEVVYQANLSEVFLRTGEYRTALAVASESLSTARELKSAAGETVSLFAMGLAHIGLKNLPQGRRFVDEALGFEERRGSLPGVVTLLEDLGHALEKAGYTAEAVQAFHRYRELNEQVFRREKQKALLGLQERFDDEQRTRDLTILKRESQLMNERLLRQNLEQGIWWLTSAAAGLLLSMVLVLILRVRRSSRSLSGSNRELLATTETDPLTGLGNRRHLLTHSEGIAPAGTVNATLFMIDIDHFKGVNDTHGHAAGDSVLCEVARRLQTVVRDGDLLVRWGGEEFLVVVHRLGSEPSNHLAKRMLHTVSSTPFSFGREALNVTCSIGFASFPMGSGSVAPVLDNAIHVVDSAMYVAKSQGRNRACGIGTTSAETTDQLIFLAADLADAHRNGLVQLETIIGPQASRQLVPAAYDIHDAEDAPANASPASA